MKINPFKIRNLIPQQSKIIQETLFANGYAWQNGQTSLDWLESKHLIFGSKDATGLLYGSINEFPDDPTFNSIQELTFIDFENLYVSYSDLSNHIGRYIEALVDEPNGGNVKKGEIGIVINKSCANFPSHNRYSCTFALDFIGKDKYKLLPPEYQPKDVKDKKFILPEKWWIQCNKDNYKSIYDWINIHSDVKRTYNSIYDADINSKICFPSHKCYHQNKGDSSYTEITFEQFKKYVLKETEQAQNISEIKELALDEIYYCEGESGYNHSYIFKAVEDLEYCPYIIVHMNDFSDDGDFSTDEGRLNLRIATQEEKDWLNHCIQINKFISIEKTLKNINPIFEVGKWYINTNNTWIVKFIHDSKYVDGQLWHGDHVDVLSNTFYPQNNSISHLYGYEWKELQLENVQEYLPHNHPDKHTTNYPNKITQSLEGLYAVFLENDIDGNGKQAGDIARICEEEIHNGWSMIYYSDGISNYIEDQTTDIRRFETLEEAKKFVNNMPGLDSNAFTLTLLEPYVYNPNSRKDVFGKFEFISPLVKKSVEKSVTKEIKLKIHKINSIKVL